MAEKYFKNGGFLENQHSIDDSKLLLEEVFRDLDVNLYADYRHKLENVLKIYNDDDFLFKVNNKISDINCMFTDLKNKTTSKINSSVYEGIVTLKENLDSILNEVNKMKFFNCDLYELLNKLVTDDFFDFQQSTKSNEDKLFSLLFDKHTDNEPTNNNNNNLFENEQNVNNKFEKMVNDDVKYKFEQNLGQAKSQIKEWLLEKLKNEFKPLEKKLQNGKYLCNITFNMVDFLGNRKIEGWFAQVETKFISYLNSKDSSSNRDELKKFIDKEKLENDKHHFVNQLNSFFQKFNYPIDYDKNNSNEKMRLFPKLKKFYVHGMLLLFDSSWILLKTMLFNDDQLYKEYERKQNELEKISDTLDVKTYMPLIIIRHEKDKNDDQKSISINIRGSFNASELSQNIRENYSDATPLGYPSFDNVVFKLKRSSLNSFVKHLMTMTDFKLKAVLIRDCKIALGTQLLNPSFNRFYGDTAIPEDVGFNLNSFMFTKFGRLMRGDYPYYCPNGWFRYGLKVCDSSMEFDRNYSNWPVAYHGTSSLALMNILKSGFLISKSLGDGCHVEGWYFSPSIEYSAHYRYSKIMTFMNKKNERVFLQAVFQCRLNPKSFTKNDIKQETLLEPSKKKTTRIDPNFSNEELEWIITEKNYNAIISNGEQALVIYGIMMRISKEHPKNLQSSKWWADSGAKNWEIYKNYD